MHYGRLGMKWGVRNGPPYPLRTSSGNPVSNHTYRIIQRNNTKRVGKGGGSNADKHEKNDSTFGLNEVSKLSEKEYDKKIANMTPYELGKAKDRIDLENNIRRSVKTKDDLEKEEKEKNEKEARREREARVKDAKDLANETAELARGMKNLQNSNPTNRGEKTYIDIEKIRKMTNEELIAAAERARLENQYLNSANLTVQKGKKGINWEKIATIAGIAATGVTIYGTLKSIQERNDSKKSGGQAKSNKPTTAQKSIIRSMHKNGFTINEIAERMDLSESAISDVVEKKDK